ncbi:MAG: hypothetical protein V1755_02810 [Chloroflexota bacterium]
MRRGKIFWGFLLVVLGGLYFLKTPGYMGGDVFGWSRPVLIVTAGAWILMGGFRARHMGCINPPTSIQRRVAPIWSLTAAPHPSR